VVSAVSSFSSFSRVFGIRNGAILLSFFEPQKIDETIEVTKFLARSSFF
jgi:hypothetical protein